MERTFDRVVKFDERSKSYPIRTLVATKPLRSFSWKHLQLLEEPRRRVDAELVGWRGAGVDQPGGSRPTAGRRGGSVPGTEPEDADLTRCAHRRKRLLKFNRYWDGSTETVWECLNPECKEHFLDHDAP